MSTGKENRSEADAHRLHSAAIHLLRRLRRADAATGLNAPRLSALSVIVFAGPLTLGKLAETEQVRPPTMTRIVHALEEQRLIRKGQDEKDRRTILLTATEKGRRLLLAGRARRVAALAGKIESLTSAEQHILSEALAILEKLNAIL
jgi:DNA-binding MarR family transcriptional regulator